MNPKYGDTHTRIGFVIPAGTSAVQVQKIKIRRDGNPTEERDASKNDEMVYYDFAPGELSAKQVSVQLYVEMANGWKGHGQIITISPDAVL